MTPEPASHGSPQGGYKPAALRDRIAWVLCNWILRHVATDWYCVRVEGAIRYGLAAAARDEHDGREKPPWPPPWFSSIEKVP